MNVKKIRADSRLNRLTEKQRQVLIEYCETTTLYAGAKWLKRKYGVKLSPQNLGKWLAKKRAGELSFMISTALPEPQDSGDNEAKLRRRSIELELLYSQRAALQTSILVREREIGELRKSLEGEKE